MERKILVDRTKSEITSDRIIKALDLIFRDKDIHVLVLDYDNTLVDTQKLYQTRMNSYAKAIADLANSDADEVYQSMRQDMFGLHGVYLVHLTLMQEAARITALRHGLDFYSPRIRAATAELMQIYQSTPGLFEGVVETLDVFGATAASVVIASHTEDALLQKRLRDNGIRGKVGKVYGFSTLKEKGEEEWQGVFDDLGVRPDQAIVVGDSWVSDIQPAIQIGLPWKNVFRVKTAYEIANNGGVDGICEVDRFSDMPYAILQAFGQPDFAEVG